MKKKTDSGVVTAVFQVYVHWKIVLFVAPLNRNTCAVTCFLRASHTKITPQRTSARIRETPVSSGSVTALTNDLDQWVAQISVIG